MRTEIIIMLHSGFTPKQIMNMTGYSPALVYYYNRAYKVGLAKFKEMLNAKKKEN